MPKYSVLLIGENFPIKNGEDIELLGFYTTTRLKALNVQDAELRAVEIIKSDSKILDSVVTQENVKPRIYMEDIKQLKWWSRLKCTGYTFYPMDSE